MTIEEIKKIADLSKLEFSNEELKAFEKDFSCVDKMLDNLDKASIKGVEYLIPIMEYDQLREDEVKPSYAREEVLKNAPKKDSISFILPKVVE
jgi:aspartyl-tRNA(Asn)/glutamyl-tRNA(Gln) amidotransferase subunit C